jgi:hypothetical protein
MRQGSALPAQDVGRRIRDDQLNHPARRISLRSAIARLNSTLT